MRILIISVLLTCIYACTSMPTIIYKAPKLTPDMLTLCQAPLAIESLTSMNLSGIVLLLNSDGVRWAECRAKYKGLVEYMQGQQ